MAAEPAATAIKPTVVIVSGGWHVPKTYTKLVTGLEWAGFEVHVPTLPAMNGSRPPNAGLAEDTRVVRDYVQSLCNAGHYMLVLMHSYGGQVGTNALVGLGCEARAPQQGGVVGLVYMTASALDVGVSMIDKVKEFGHEELMPVAFDFAGDMTVKSRYPKDLMIGPGVSDEEVDQYIADMVGFNGQAMYQPLERCAWKKEGEGNDIPVTYIYTTTDMTLPFDYQKSMVEGMRKTGKHVDTFEIATGHCPNLTATGEVVAIIERVAATVEIEGK